MVRGAALLMVVMATPALAASQSPGRCPIEQAVYKAGTRNEEKRMPPDELRFRFPRKGDDWQTALGMPRVVLKSAERKLTLNLDPYFTNSSGVVGVTGSIPYEALPASLKDFSKDQEGLDLESIAMVVFEDFTVSHLPSKEHGKAPKVVMFPEFRRLAHISTQEAVGSGISWGVFAFSHCDRNGSRS